MTDQEALVVTGNEFQREMQRRNMLLRGTSSQVDNLNAQKAQVEKEINGLNVSLELRRKEAENLDAVFEGKMADYQAHVNSVQKSLKEKEDLLTEQQSKQSTKETQQTSKELELSGRLNNIEAKKDNLIKLLTNILNKNSKAIQDAIDDVKGI